MSKIGLAVAGLATAVLLTGCGGKDDGGSGGGGGGAAAGSDGDFAGLSARQIADSAKSDMAGLHSLRVAGTVATSGTKITIDLQMDGDGNCTGSLSTTQGEVRLLGADGWTWMKPDAAFWRGMAGAQADRVMRRR